MEDYELEVSEDYFKVERTVEGNVEEIVSVVSEEYGFEVDKAGEIYTLTRENIKAGFKETGEAYMEVSADREPKNWVVNGINAILKGEKVPLDMEYFSEEDYLAELRDRDFEYSLDREERTYGEGATRETSPKL